ncbi:hypothetical protein AB0K80_26755 [Streptomyces sp. NPDC052682]
MKSQSGHQTAGVGAASYWATVQAMAWQV